MLHPRVRLALMAVSTIALLAIAGFVIFSDPRSGASTPAVTGGFAGSLRPDAPAADFTLDDQDGRPVRVLERPGLWNGGMSLWNTVFVEIPSNLFHPVKTVTDLFRPGHRSRAK